MQRTRSKWFQPVFAVTLGVVMLGAQAIRGLRGDGRDERFRQIDINATAFAGIVVIVAIIIAFLIELARGHSGAPFTWLGAIAGLAYLIAVVVLRVRG
jgi:undecaprenyl pyrophosphate phosphatase UppP